MVVYCLNTPLSVYRKVNFTSVLVHVWKIYIGSSETENVDSNLPPLDFQKSKDVDLCPPSTIR